MKAEYTVDENTLFIFGVFNRPSVFIIWALFYRLCFFSFSTFERYIFWITSSESSSSERLDIKFKLFILYSITDESNWTDFGSLAEEKTEVGYLDSGSLKWVSTGVLLVREEAHINPNNTARHRYLLLWIEVEFSLFKTNDSIDSSVPSEVWELLF